MCGNEPRDGGSNGNLERKRTGAYREAADFQSCQQLDFSPQIGLAGEHLRTALQKYAAKCGGLNAFGSAVEQPNSDGSFQRRNAARHRGLGQMQCARRSREISKTRQGECVLDEPEFNHDT